MKEEENTFNASLWLIRRLSFDATIFVSYMRMCEEQLQVEVFSMRWCHQVRLMCMAHSFFFFFLNNLFKIFETKQSRMASRRTEGGNEKSPCSQNKFINNN